MRNHYTQREKELIRQERKELFKEFLEELGRRTLPTLWSLLGVGLGMIITLKIIK